MKYLTTKEAAERLNVSRPRIYQLIEEGKLLAEKFGRDFQIKESALKNVETYGKPGRPASKNGSGETAK